MEKFKNQGFNFNIVYLELTFAFGGSSAGAEQQQIDEIFAVPHQQLLILLNAAQ